MAKRKKKRDPAEIEKQAAMRAFKKRFCKDYDFFTAPAPVGASRLKRR